MRKRSTKNVLHFLKMTNIWPVRMQAINNYGAFLLTLRQYVVMEQRLSKKC
ncbi:hypothetical protein GA0061071_101588 [Kosakonia oryzendophytica]|uniref:Uncharacterized protein n=1 Tax=Kosakonia oryzendophytica TaxID=1005665 RepID=A0A1C3ZEX1_9ENTR|nr:hypothetical protein DFO53_0068 [Enterobacter sp. AG5470]SCB80949.1 hypothetical protein GA0061071_101588 [Kosakonia oryzendophytica]